MDKILILDFGGQTCQLISRRIRESGVYTEIAPHDTEFTPGIMNGLRGIVLSGSPESVGEEGAPQPHASLWECGLPVLGICYGLQRMTQDLGGSVRALSRREYGRSRLFYKSACRLFDGVPEGFVSWMSHGDSIETAASGFQVAAVSESGLPAALFDERRRFYGIQFHPEVTHCEHGATILENFAVGIAGAGRSWSMGRYLDEAVERIRSRVGAGRVLLLISGGVDSTVVAALLLRALDPDRVHLMYIDTGLMRQDESREVAASLTRLGARHLHLVDASERFLAALRGIDDPEEKRRVIGDLFMHVQEEELGRLGVGNALLAQGTLYTDMIESGKGVGKKAHVIKSHHNVRSPLVEAKRSRGEIIEPLDLLYKDEVRKLGMLLDLPREILYRHPFPGPGLGVRILGEVTRQKCDVLRSVDAILIRELKARSLYDRIWQAFAVLLPLRSVGVAGDARKYGWVCALRAVVSHDGMSADVFEFPSRDLLEISSIITNEVHEVGRVVYDVSSKPPATIEWE